MTAKAAIGLNDRDNAILSVLTNRVRVLSLSQVGRTWWADGRDPERNARRRLTELERAGLVECFDELIRPELPLQQPVLIWQPGLPEPDFGSSSRLLQARWRDPIVRTECVIATARAGRAFGGKGGRRPRKSEVTHDVHLAAVFLRMREELPTRAASWTPEAQLPTGPGIKVPDAIVRDGRYFTAIEFGGEYSSQKLKRFHRYCENESYGYEIW